MVEKQSVDVEQRPAGSGIDIEVLTADKTVRHGVHLAEAAELYADTRAVESYGYVARGSVEPLPGRTKGRWQSRTDASTDSSLDTFSSWASADRSGRLCSWALEEH